MRTIWKYLVPHGAEGPAAPVAKGGIVRHTGIDPETNKPAIWIEFDKDDVERKERRFGFFPTGAELPEGWVHVGSAITSTGYVWHVYEGVA